MRNGWTLRQRFVALGLPHGDSDEATHDVLDMLDGHREAARLAVEECRRLRALIKDAEESGALDYGDNRTCPWCDADRDSRPRYNSTNEPHAANCPAFAPDGLVR